MKEQVQNIENLFNEKYQNVNSNEELEALRVEFLGKKGLVTNLMPLLRDVPVEQKREAGMLINTLKNSVEGKIAEKKEQARCKGGKTQETKEAETTEEA